jgi:hypothetical protein
MSSDANAPLCNIRESKPCKLLSYVPAPQQLCGPQLRKMCSKMAFPQNEHACRRRRLAQRPGRGRSWQRHCDSMSPSRRSTFSAMSCGGRALAETLRPGVYVLPPLGNMKRSLFIPLGLSKRRVCLLLQYLLQSCLRVGRGIRGHVLCYERRRAEALRV